jgi:hypothetical protein
MAPEMGCKPAPHPGWSAAPAVHSGFAGNEQGVNKLESGAGVIHLQRHADAGRRSPIEL